MTTALDWQAAVGRNWAELHALTDRSFSGLTEHLLGRIALHPGEVLLDVGCGAGELSLALARARPRARITGIDISPDLVMAAKARAGTRDQPRFVLGDAASWSEPGFSPDLLVSRHGVMFFDDPSIAFGHLRGIAREEATLVFSCFRSARENPWASGIAELLGLPSGDPQAPGPFAFADPQRVEGILRAGGWQGFDFEPVDFAWIAGVGADAVGDALAYVSRIGPAAPALAALEGGERTAAEAKLRTWFQHHRSGDLVAFAAAAWIVTARAERRTRER